MKKVKSKFVKKLISQNVEDEERREYINDLINLEWFILNGVHGYASARYYHHLKRKYRKEWEAIYSELNPEKFKEIIAEEQRIEEERRREREKDLFAGNEELRAIVNKD